MVLALSPLKQIRPKVPALATEGAELILFTEGNAFQSTYLPPPSFVGDFRIESVYWRAEWN